MERVDLRRGAWYAYLEDWLTADFATAAFDALHADVDWQQLPINIRGEQVMQPRLLGWAGELAYRYNGLTLPAQDPHPVIADLLDRARNTCDEPFNHVVLNLYRDGRDHVAMHSDDEPELGIDPTIGSLSLGAERHFVMKAKGRKFWKRMPLAHGSLLVNGGTFQRTLRHGVPKRVSDVGPRINVTFRTLGGPPGWRAAGDRRPVR